MNPLKAQGRRALLVGLLEEPIPTGCSALGGAGPADGPKARRRVNTENQTFGEQPELSSTSIHEVCIIDGDTFAIEDEGRCVSHNNPIDDTSSASSALPLH